MTVLVHKIVTYSIFNILIQPNTTYRVHNHTGITKIPSKIPTYLCYLPVPDYFYFTLYKNANDTKRYTFL